MRRLVIVGASLAGLRAAQAARSAGHQGEIVLIGAEPHLPYTRPPLSKDLLEGRRQAGDCFFALGELTVDWRLGSPAAALDPAAHSVTLTDGSEVAYDRLVIATGCRARQWRGTGAHLQGVHTLRDLGDAMALSADLAGGSHLLVVGAGFIGCEVAASARKLGLQVTLVDIAPHPMLPLGAELGERWLALHRMHGVDVRMGVGVDSLQGDVRVSAAQLTNGQRLTVDTVLFALGSQLNGEWLQGSGIESDGGIKTDSTLTTLADRDILAAGDIAACPAALAAGEPLRIEHWTTAAEHGQLAGRNGLLPAGERSPHTGTPYFWTDQYDQKVQAVGLPAAGDRTELLESDPDADRVVFARLRGDSVLGIVAINSARRIAFYRRQLSTPLTLAELKERISAEQPGGATASAPSAAKS